MKSNNNYNKQNGHAAPNRPGQHKVHSQGKTAPGNGNRPMQKPTRNMPGKTPAGKQIKRPQGNNQAKKKKVKINPVGILTLIMIILILIIIVVAVKNAVSGKDPKSPKATKTSEITEVSAEETVPTQTQIDLDLFEGIYSTNAIVIDAEDGTVIKGLNEDVQGYPASVTKMMTTIVALENIDDIDARYTMPSSIYDYLFTRDLSTAGFENMESVSFRDLLYGTMLRSGAECCLALANNVGGSEEVFVQMMNDKAAEIGMTNTHFMNCTGEHDPEHYSTVHDMAILLQYGLQNEMFRTLITSSEYTSSSTDQHPDGITMYNSFHQTFGSPDAGGATLLGGKTGFTTEAGQCLASFASIDGHEYILVTFGASVPAGSSVYAGHLHVDDAFLIYARLAAYLTGGPTPTPRVAETVATTTAETSATESSAGATPTPIVVETTTAATTEQTTQPDTTYITFG